MEWFAGLARGSYLGCIGWTALEISNSVATVGQIFIVQSLTTMITGPVIGVTIDRHETRKLIVITQLIIVSTMIAIAIFLYYSPHISIPLLFGAVVVISVARLTYRGTFDRIIKASAVEENILSTIAKNQAIHLIATAIGMAGVGAIINIYTTSQAFVFSALSSAFVMLVACFLPFWQVKSNTQGLIGYWRDFKDGLRIFTQNKQIRLLALLSAIALPVGQLSNAILSSFIRDDLGRGSYVFGLVDAGWAIGGMVAAMILSKKTMRLSTMHGEYYMAGIAGALTIVFSYCVGVYSLIIAHALMGFTVWFCRILIAGRVLEISEENTVGRTKIYIEVMFSTSAMLMCLSPTLITLNATSLYFTYWGGIHCYFFDFIVGIQTNKLQSSLNFYWVIAHSSILVKYFFYGCV